MKTNKILSSFLLVFAVIFALPYCLSAQQIRIEVQGAPSFQLTAMDVSDAGEDIVGTNEVITESQSNTRLNILSSDENDKYNYQVWVKAVNLPEGVMLSVFRDGSGTNKKGGPAKGNISGGDSLEPITVGIVPSLFFFGSDDRINVPLKFTLSKISVAQPIENLGYHLVFEVIRL